jgi:fibronectin type 3 domain-containing protein
MKTITKVFSVVLLLNFTLLTIGCGNVENKAQASQSNAPAAPSGVVATSNINKVTLDWSPVSGANYYNVYWSVSPGVTPATGTKVTVDTNRFQHLGLYASRVYFYVVTSVSSSGESTPSDLASTVPGTDGENLYVTYCLDCHGPVTSFKTAVEGNEDNIKAAIAADKGGMKVLSTLTDNQIYVISQQLPCH